MKPLVIYTDFVNNRLEYVCDFIFRKYLRLDFDMVTSAEAFQMHPAEFRLIYGKFSDGMNSVRVPDSGLIENFAFDRKPQMFETLEMHDGQLSFDVFAAAFYIISRAEEYPVQEKDVHDRFMLKNSILKKKGWHDKPVVDYWIEQLRTHMSGAFSRPIPQKEGYRFMSTVDIDHIYAFRQKPWEIQFSSLVRDLASAKFSRVVDRFRSDDPYDTFEQIVKWHQSLYLNPVFFVMCADRGPYDKILSHTHPAYVEKINYLNKYYNVGIHPSYASNSKLSRMQHEKMKLESVIGEKIHQSRQHYLRFSLPDTYRILIEMGINQEYSMGFHESLGFRCGTCHVHYWYDIDADQVSGLKLYPFQVMDMTLKKYMQLEPAEAFDKSRAIIDRVREVQGVFSLIWHNSSFYNNEGWEGWKELYIQLLKYAKP